MDFVKFSILIFLILSIGVTTLYLSPNALAQFQDPSCNSCVMISNSKALQIHESLELPILVWSDQFRYTFDHNSMIHLNGKTNLNALNSQVSVTVFNPIGNVVSIKQVPVDADGQFKISLNTAGALWKKDGFYIIKVQGQSESQVFKTQVNIIKNVDSTLPAGPISCTPNEFPAGDQCISYSVSGATLVGASIDSQSKSLSVNIDTTNDGSITIEIPRSVLDAKSNGMDEAFIILIDGQETEYSETTTSSSRTITMSFSDGSEIIEVVGTFAIPEFATLAILIMAVAITSLFVISKRTPILIRK